MKAPRLLWLLTLSIASFALAQDETPTPAPPAEMVETRDAFAKSLADIQALATKRREQLKAAYVAGLENFQKQSSQIGNLDAVLAIRTEVERAQGGSAAAAQRSTLPPEVVDWIGRNQNSERLIAAEAGKSEQAARAKYLQDLQALQVKLTKDGQIEQALAVRREREAQGKSPAVTPSAAPADTAPLASPGLFSGPSDPFTAATSMPPTAPQPPTATAPTVPPATGRKVATIPANMADGYLLGSVRRGTKISLQYVSGNWKSWGRLSSSNPDDANTGGGDYCRLVLSRPASEGKAGEVLAIVPPETKRNPFVFEAKDDYPSVVLRINDKDDTYSGNPGKVDYSISVSPPR